MFDLDVIGAGLVVAGSKAELETALRHGAMVVTAPPGTGKTTFVPPLVSNAAAVGGPSGRTILTQPRRVAVRAAASRLAQLDGSTLGDRVGFTVRGERKMSAHTRIEVVTPGVLLRRLLSDPGLEGVSALIVDEVHERSVDGDVLLGMLKDVRMLREDISVTAMSATLNAELIAELLGDSTRAAPIVDIPSALHPLHLDYAPPTGPRLDDRGVTRGYLAHLAEVAATAQAEHDTDALVFVPGAREVDEVVRLLRSRTGEAVEVLSLHGRISAREQDRAVRGRANTSDPHRIVVSTSLAESSLTVPGVRLVIDSGLAREVRRDRARDMTGLVTVSASRSSAEQRAGRAARQGPGRAIRAYDEVDFARMPAESTPEIRSADLLDTALLLAAWGTPGARGLSLLTDPPPEAMQRAEHLLAALGLVDAQGRPTEQGTRVARLPLGVREARALLTGVAELGDAQRVAGIIAAFSGDFRAASGDLTALLKDLRSERMPDAKRWRSERDRLAKLVRGDSERDDAGIAGTDGDDAAGLVTALARPEWVARRVSDSARTYLLASGTRAAVPDGSPLRASEWIAVRDVQRADGGAADGTGAVIRLAAPISEAQAIRIADSLMVHEREARIDAGRVKVREVRRLGAISLADLPVAPTAEDTGPAFAAHLNAEGLSALNWSEHALALRNRLGLLFRELGAPWPDMTDAALLESLDDWLGPDLQSLRPRESLSSIDVTSALRKLLPWPEAARLDELAPERLRLPSGGSARIEYPDPTDDAAPPVVAAKLQEFFGLAHTPRIVEGRVPMLMHLLSPARKPLAVTADLESFWNGPYAEVRKEMRGRYPRHPWPEDPWTAQATALTTHKLAARSPKQQ